MNLGHLYVVHTVLSKPPKDKLAICVCGASDLFLWVNTNARQHGIAQMPLGTADHGALTHDCFLDCSRITTFRPNELANAIDRGIISAPLAARIAAFVAGNPPKTLTQGQAAMIAANLGTVV